MLHLGKYFGYISHGAIRILGYTPKLNKYIKNKENTTLEERYAHVRIRIDDVLHNILRINLQVEGLDKLDEGETYLFTPNHQGFIDPLCLINIFKEPLIMVSKKESLKMPFVGKITRIIDAIFLDRESPRDALRMVKECKEHLNNGRSVVIFPEGTRSKDENVTIATYKPGAFKCAYNTNCKIVPVVIEGSYIPLSLKRKNKENNLVKISFLDPISKEEYEKLNTTELASMVETKAKEKLELLRNE